MSYKIDPSGYCANDGCTRPKATGEAMCSQCSRLARAVGSDAVATDAASADTWLDIPQTLEGQRRPPRCVAYLSVAGDVITLELTGEPRFTRSRRRGGRGRALEPQEGSVSHPPRCALQGRRRR
jgi:hypothetical protein